MQNKGNKLDSLSDFELWRKFKTGDKYALIEIYSRYFDALYNYAHQFTDDTLEIEDHLQDMFVDLFYKKHKLSDTDNIKFYLFKVLKRRILYIQKKQNKIQKNLLPNGETTTFHIELSEEQKIINHQFAEEKVHLLNKALQKLKPSQREALFYFYNEGMTLEQIRDILGFQNTKSVQNLIYRAIHILKNNFHTIYLFIAGFLL